MSQYYVMRTIDNMGRIVIPKNMREALNLKHGDMVCMSVNTDMNEILISKADENRTVQEALQEALKRVDTSGIPAELKSAVKDRIEALVSCVEAMGEMKNPFEDTEK